MLRRTLRALAVAALTIAAVPAVASAAQIQVDRACYADPRDVGPSSITITGSSFTPNAPFQVALDGAAVAGGTGVTDANGVMTGTLSVPSLKDYGSTLTERLFRLRVAEGPNAPETLFRVSRLFGDFTPTRGNPATLRVRFFGYGFRIGGGRGDVYLHYVDPRGRLRRTIRLGKAVGTCGRLRPTHRMRLFPFATHSGRYTLQFDLHKSYRRGSARSTFLYYKTIVQITR